MKITQDEYAELLQLANRWSMRAKVATALAIYFCELTHPDGPMIDVKREVEDQAEKLLKMDAVAVRDALAKLKNPGRLK